MALKKTKQQIKALIDDLLTLQGKDNVLAFEGAIAFKEADGSIYAAVMPESINLGKFTVEIAEAFKHSVNAGKAAGRAGSSIILFNSIIVTAFIVPAMLLVVLVSPNQNLKSLIPEVEKTADLIKKIM